MEIQKILNNNVVITNDDNGHEIIVTGRGLAFKKRPGDYICRDKVDKVYPLENNSLAQKFQELMQEVPVEFLEMTNSIVNYATKKLHVTFNESIYISLTDHLYTCVKREQSGIEVRNVLLWDIKRFFPEEYAIGEKTITKIKDIYDIQLSEDEVGFIALHLVNAQGEEGGRDMLYLTEIRQDITNIARRHFKMEFNEDSVYFYRFSSHLRFFVSRLLQKTPHTGESDNDLFMMVKHKYCNAAAAVEKINAYVHEKFSYELSNDEKLYLIIHLARLVQKSN